MLLPINISATGAMNNKKYKTGISCSETLMEKVIN